MKVSIPIFVFALCLFSCTGYGQNEPDRKDKPKTKQEEPAMQQEVPAMPDQKKVEIDPSELPKEVHTEVRDNYYNGEIIRAYKLMDDGKHSGYVAEVKNGPKKWTLEFDEKGNSVNKIVPNK